MFGRRFSIQGDIWRNVRGNVAIIVAFAIPVIVLSVGGAIDFNRMLQLRNEMQDAADVASVGAVAINSMAFKASTQIGSGEIAVGETQAITMFKSGMQNTTDLTGMMASATVIKTTNTLTSTVTATGTFKPLMLGVLGFSALPIAVTSKSITTIPPYIDFYLLLDNSPSMGVGATTADINKMVANTSDKCAFACHQKDMEGKDYYTKAKKLGVTTRIDVVRQATQNLMTKAGQNQTMANQFRMAIYDFGLSADTIDAQNPTAYQVSALTTDLVQSASNAAKIDLMVMPYAGYNSDRQTNFKSTLTSMNNLIPAPGDGLTAAAPQKVLFMVSDGANDSYDCNYTNGNTCRRITPLDTTQCAAIKARGIRIAVLYTTYLPLPTNSFYNSWLAKYVAAPSQLATQMQACASPGLYFEVSPSQGISEAMQALFNKVVTVVRLNG
ncbi:hypothetical protein AEAC466_04090 [Asticcacaulis sp. AC466]|uniref:TadE/TadG family type IV pilus assembly protein n=1 Tax=Asticcacaulis sp. AC466 TaxID=1282362 RepID=UPI0003C3FADC|nr:pilus assembly protein TadG-related protein [Asticcacaulis sp. AC466]ESQ86390.1 hypothetical protein AEAC466_04090 [Asticcacaulis sp. AC466]